MLVRLMLTLLSLTIICSAQLSAAGSCGSEVATLKRNIQKLENKLLVRTWQVEHLQTHKYFQPIQPDVSDNQQVNTVPWMNHSINSGTLNHTNSALIKPHPPAVGLMVYDKDCSKLFERRRPPSGFYRIQPSLHREPFLTYCDMEDGGGWTVFQRRRHGKVNFDRDWVDYKDGFGEFKLWNDEFWLGNEHIHSLLSEDSLHRDTLRMSTRAPIHETRQLGQNLVKIDLMDWEGQSSHAFYNNFRITNEADRYRLQYGMYSGKAGDGLTGGAGVVEQWSACLGGMQFSTRDQDNDRYLQGSCAQENKAGWWYNRCHAANLNGKFYRKGVYKGQFDDGVVWGTWKGLWYSLRHTAIKVRPLVFLDAAGSGAGAM